jgi:hypothetical protein
MKNYASKAFDNLFGKSLAEPIRKYESVLPKEDEDYAYFEKDMMKLIEITFDLGEVPASCTPEIKTLLKSVLEEKAKYPKASQAVKDCVAKKIPKLMAEGKPQDQAVAIAFSMCGEKHKSVEVPLHKTTKDRVTAPAALSGTKLTDDKGQAQSVVVAAPFEISNSQPAEKGGGTAPSITAGPKVENPQVTTPEAEKGGGMLNDPSLDDQTQPGGNEGPNMEPKLRPKNPMAIKAQALVDSVLEDVRKKAGPGAPPGPAQSEAAHRAWDVIGRKGETPKDETPTPMGDEDEEQEQAEGQEQPQTPEADGERGPDASELRDEIANAVADAEERGDEQAQERLAQAESALNEAEELQEAGDSEGAQEKLEVASQMSAAAQEGAPEATPAPSEEGVAATPAGFYQLASSLQSAKREGGAAKAEAKRAEADLMAAQSHAKQGNEERAARAMDRAKKQVDVAIAAAKAARQQRQEAMQERLGADEPEREEPEAEAPEVEEPEAPEVEEPEAEEGTDPSEMTPEEEGGEGEPAPERMPERGEVPQDEAPGGSAEAEPEAEKPEPEAGEVAPSKQPHVEAAGAAASRTYSILRDEKAPEEARAAAQRAQDAAGEAAMAEGEGNREGALKAAEEAEQAAREAESLAGGEAAGEGEATPMGPEAEAETQVLDEDPDVAPEEGPQERGPEEETDRLDDEEQGEDPAQEAPSAADTAPTKHPLVEGAAEAASRANAAAEKDPKAGEARDRALDASGRAWSAMMAGDEEAAQAAADEAEQAAREAERLAGGEAAGADEVAPTEPEEDTQADVATEIDDADEETEPPRAGESGSFEENVRQREEAFSAPKSESEHAEFFHSEAEQTREQLNNLSGSLQEAMSLAGSGDTAGADAKIREVSDSLREAGARIERAINTALKEGMFSGISEDRHRKTLEAVMSAVKESGGGDDPKRRVEALGRAISGLRESNREVGVNATRNADDWASIDDPQRKAMQAAGSLKDRLDDIPDLSSDSDWQSAVKGTRDVADALKVLTVARLNDIANADVKGELTAETDKLIEELNQKLAAAEEAAKSGDKQRAYREMEQTLNGAKKMWDSFLRRLEQIAAQEEKSMTPARMLVKGVMDHVLDRTNTTPDSARVILKKLSDAVPVKTRAQQLVADVMAGVVGESVFDQSVLEPIETIEKAATPPVKKSVEKTAVTPAPTSAPAIEREPIVSKNLNDQFFGMVMGSGPKQSLPGILKAQDEQDAPTQEEVNKAKEEAEAKLPGLGSTIPHWARPFSKVASPNPKSKRSR